MVRLPLALLLGIGIAALLAEEGRAQDSTFDVPSSPEPIAEVRTDAEGNAVPDRVGDTVVVAGRALANLGDPAVPVSGITALQDLSGGIHAIFPGEAAVRRGDSLRVKGILEHRYGLAQLNVRNYKVVASAGRRVPDPVPLTVPAAAGERYEGRLVRVEGQVVETGRNQGGKYLILTDDGSHPGDPDREVPTKIIVFVEENETNRIRPHRFEAGNQVEVAGLLGQHDYESPYTSYYQVVPRQEADLARTGPWRYFWPVVYVLLGGGALVGGGLIYGLRALIRRRTRKLAEKEKRLRSITENVSDGIYRSNSEEGIVYANQAFVEMFGYSGLDDLRDADATQLYADPARREELIEKEAEEGRLDREEVRYRRKDGTTFIGLVSSQQVGGQEAGTTYSDGAITDITDRKRRERKLKILSETVEQTTDGILITEAPDLEEGEEGESGPIVYVNAAFEEMTGYAEEELRGREPQVFRGPETDLEVIASLREAQRKGRPWKGETVNYKKDGTPYAARWTATPIFGDEDQIQYWVSIQRDVSKERRREKELRRAKEEAEEAARLKSSMLANMSHEIRTPLTSIIGFAEALGEEMESKEGPVGRFAGLIEKGGKRLLKTLGGVLNLSKLEAGEMELSSGSVDLTGQAEAAVKQYRPEAEKKGLDLGVETNGAPARAWADEGGVQIVLQNLVSNAIKYTEEGGVEVRTYEEDGEAVLKVEDTGIGMDSELVEDLFDPFRQESEGMSRRFEGTGVGLAVTKKAVEQMGGSIEVSTEKGEGSRFTVRLPQAEESGEETK